MQTKKLLLGDISALHRFGRRNMVQGKNEGFFWSEAQLLAIHHGGNPIAVAKEGNRIVGYAIALVHPETNFAFIHNDFFVEDPYRGKGVRQQLLAEIRQQLATRPVPVTNLTILVKHVDKGNDEGFFRQNGFKGGSPMWIWVSALA